MTTVGEPAITRHWRWWVLILWLGATVWLIHIRWQGILWYSLPDTDDNMRMAQVRALIAGQGWFDLRQHKLNPPIGFNIHWSRLVDLPIAALIVALKPWFGGMVAEKAAATIAPMLPLLVAMMAMALAARRLIARPAFFLAVALILCCQAALLMFMPLRVDHHGWQLALLVLTIAGLADGNPRRGGITMGLASAASLVIGLELMPFLAIAGTAVALRWVWTPADRGRLEAYGLALALGCAAGYLVFASNDNRIPRCDVLSPVWLSTMIAAGWIAFLLARFEHADWRQRLAAGAAGGALIVAGFALLAPQCLGRPEQVSPELMRLWLSNIREAKPLYVQDWQTVLSVIALPLVGVIGSIHACYVARRSEKLAVWAPVALVSCVSLGLVMWQTRMGPAAQLMAVPGATALGWSLLPWLAQREHMLVRVPGILAVILLVSGLGVQLVLAQIPGKPLSARSKAINRANFLCPSLRAMRPIARLPETTIFTFVDLGPRLINVTHHRAVAGPYHRNGDAILDMHHAFGGTPERARAIMKRHGATLLMTCPNMSEATIYRVRTPRGFYSRLATGERFAWLDPVPLPAGSPLLLWRIR